MKSVYGKYVTKVAFVWTCCFVLFFFLYMLMLAPQKGSKEQLKKQLEEKKQMYNSALKASEKETQIQLNERIEQLRDELNNFVVDFNDAANLTFDISKIANEKEVSSFRVEASKRDNRDQPATEKYISESFFDISFSTTDFIQFAALLNALERHQPVIFVDRFSITRSDRSGSGRQVKMNLSVFVRKIQDS